MKITYGPKCEIKNLNNFSFDELANYEFECQPIAFNKHLDIKNNSLRLWKLIYNL